MGETARIADHVGARSDGREPNGMHPVGRSADRGELCMPVKVGASAARLALCPAGRKETAQAPGGKKGDVMSSVFRAKRAGGRMWGGRQPGATASGGQLRRPPRDSRGEAMGAAGTVSGGQPEGNELRRRV